MVQQRRIEIDPLRPLATQPGKGHNRWHEAIPPALEVEPGEPVALETWDAFDAQLTPQSTIHDVAKADLGRVHPLTGPVYVKGAQPGDLLEVKILEIEADPWRHWGYTVQVPGFGFLRDQFPQPYIIHWHLYPSYAESPQLPGVRILAVRTQGQSASHRHANCVRKQRDGRRNSPRAVVSRFHLIRTGLFPQASRSRRRGFARSHRGRMRGMSISSSSPLGRVSSFPFGLKAPSSPSVMSISLKAMGKSAAPRLKCARSSTWSSVSTRGKRVGGASGHSSSYAMATSLPPKWRHRAASTQRPVSVSAMVGTNRKI